MALAAAYAANADFEEFVEGWTTDDATALTRLLSRSSDDVDSLLGAYEVIVSGDWAGRKLDPSTLDYAQQRGLIRATCAQAQYRLEMGEEFFVRPQMEEVGGPEFSTKGKLPRVSPTAKQELSGLDLIRATTSIGNTGRGRPPWWSFSYNETPVGEGDFGGLNPRFR